MFRFQDPQYLSYTLLAIVVFALTLWGWYRANRLMSKYIHPRLASILTLSVSKSRRRWKLFLQLAVLVLMAFALGRPQLGLKTERVKIQGIEIVLAVDVSNSMMAEDAKPNRLSLVKKTIERLLDRLPGHRVGLIAFAGSPAVVSPLTTDYSAVRMFVDSLTTDSVSQQGTNVRDTMAHAFSAFKRGGVDESETEKVTRVLVLFSDGEETEGGALDKAKDLVSQGVRIFAVGVGTEAGAPIPERDDYGNLKGYKKGPNGETHLSKVNYDFLKDLGSAGGGGYYHATFSGAEVGQIEEDLNKLEKSEFDSESVRNYDERFQIVLLLAFILGLLEFWLGERRQVENLVQIYRTEMTKQT